MPRISNIELLEKSAQPTLSIRTRARVDQLPLVIGESYGKLGAYLQELNQRLAGMPYVAYFNMDMQDLDLEIGFPVTGELPAREDIRPGSIPAGKYIICMYRGPYQGLNQAYDDMGKWLAENSVEPTGVVYEHYWNGMEYGEDELLTEIVMMIR